MQLIKSFEGLELYPYLDIVGVATVGYGHTGAGVDMTGGAITEERANYLLQSDLGWAERAVQRNIHVHLTQNEFDALVSFTFNLGGGALQRSTLRSMLNRGDYIGASDEFPKWRRAGGRVVRGLVRRRAAERALFLS